MNRGSLQAQAPSVPGGEGGKTAGHDPAYLACLRGAKHTCLKRKAVRHACPGSVAPDAGWFVRASWSDYQCDAAKGGPWPVETVSRLCAMGLLGIHPDQPDEARITRDGAALLRLSKRLAAQATPTDEKTGGEG